MVGQLSGLKLYGGLLHARYTVISKQGHNRNDATKVSRASERHTLARPMAQWDFANPSSRKSQGNTGTRAAHACTTTTHPARGRPDPYMKISMLRH
jgi:hypothetical protein